MKLMRYAPTYFDTETKEINEFNSLEEFLAIDWIKSVTEIQGFNKFLIKMREEPETHSTLLVQLKPNYALFPIGFVDGVIPGIDTASSWKEVEKKRRIVYPYIKPKEHVNV